MQLLCGQCGRTFQIERASPAAEAICPHCGHVISVPLAGSDAPVQQPPAGGPMEVTPEDLGQPGPDDGFAEEARQSMSRRVRVVCGNCRKALSLSGRMSGKKVKCPSCGATLQIPFPDDQDLALTSLKEFDEEPFEQLDIVDETPPEAPSETPSDVSEEGESLLQYQPRRRPLAARSAWPGTVALLVALLLAGGLAAVAAMRILGNRPGPSGPVEENASANAPSSAPVIVHRPASSSTSRTLPERTATRPIEVPASVQVMACRMDLFASEGYFPAPLGMLYVKVTLEISGGSRAMSFPMQGRGMVLWAASQPYECLGQEALDTRLPTRALTEAILVPADASRRVTLLFEVPRTLQEARLEIRGVGQTVLSFEPLPKDPAASDLAGRYTEARPRNLQPGLRDPVMSAVQTAGPLTMIIKRSGKTLDVRIPQAGVGGTAKPRDDGAYDLALGVGGQSIQCTLRPFDGAKVLLLYLSDKPFHQITFRR